MLFVPAFFERFTPVLEISFRLSLLTKALCNMLTTSLLNKIVQIVSQKKPIVSTNDVYDVRHGTDVCHRKKKHFRHLVRSRKLTLMWVLLFIPAVLCAHTFSVLSFLLYMHLFLYFFFFFIFFSRFSFIDLFRVFFIYFRRIQCRKLKDELKSRTTWIYKYRKA